MQSERSYIEELYDQMVSTFEGHETQYVPYTPSRDARKGQDHTWAIQIERILDDMKNIFTGERHAPDRSIANQLLSLFHSIKTLNSNAMLAAEDRSAGHPDRDKL